jgi:hypothetical protein
MLYYNGSWRARMRRRPLDVDDSTNTVVLRKRPDGAWFYRRRSWDTGPIMLPAPDKTLTLEALLDLVNAPPAEKWLTWKNTSPYAFGEAPGA